MALTKFPPKSANEPGDENLAPSAPAPLTTDIEALNLHHAFVMNGGKAMVMNFCTDPSLGQTVTFSNQSDFKARYATRNTFVFYDDGSSRMVQLADQWWNSSKRREYAGLTFMPGKPQEIVSADIAGKPYYNLFRGWPVAPKAGDCSLFWQHLREIICAGDEKRYTYVRRWMAHAIQKPEEMPETAIVLRGGQGAGKGTLVNIYGRLFGSHFKPVTQMDHLLGKFNAHMHEGILIFGDEVTWGSNKQSEGVLKGMISEAHMMIEKKGLDTIRCSNFRRYFFSSNDSWPVSLGNRDRRFLVLDVADSHRADTTYFGALHAQMAVGGLQALMYDLLIEDLNGFDVRTKPETGAAEAELFIRSLTSVDSFWYEYLYEADETTWPKSVSRPEFYRQYCAQAPKGKSVESPSMFGKGLHKMCDGIVNSAPRKSKSTFEMDVGTPSVKTSERDQRWVFPELEKARTSFEKYSGMGQALWAS